MGPPKPLDPVTAFPAAAAMEGQGQRLPPGYSRENLQSKKWKADVENNNTEHPGPQNPGSPNATDGEAFYDEPDSYSNLDELAAPPPVDPQEEEKEEHLEDRISEQPDAIEEYTVSRFATELYTISYLIFFSILGTLARLGLQALTSYPGAPVQTGLLWANVGGSLIMGFLSEDRQLFRQEWGASKTRTSLRRSPSADKKHGAVKKTMPLYIGLATGFCGSFTSFSSFMRDAFYALANALPVPVSHPSSAPISASLNVHRNPGFSFMAVLAVLIITVGLCLGALQFGAHLALVLEPITPAIPFLFARKVVDRTIFVLAWASWLGAVFMAIFPPDRPNGSVGKTSWSQESWRGQVLFALVFAPPGCLLRFYASLHLNGRIRAFPLGTFTVNMLGTLLEGLFIDLQRAPVGGMVGCQILQGMSDGFCGCLTTVSTWVAELKALKRRHAYVYGATTVGIGLSFMIVIIGSLMWTQGFSKAPCTT